MALLNELPGPEPRGTGYVGKVNDATKVESRARLKREQPIEIS